MGMEIGTNLEGAVEAIKNGDKAGAKRTLDEIILRNPRNEQAWELLSEVVDNPNGYLESKVLTFMRDKANLFSFSIAAVVP